MIRFLVKDWLSGIMNSQQEISHDEFHQTGGGQKIERSKQTFQIQPQSSNLFSFFSHYESNPPQNFQFWNSTFLHVMHQLSSMTKKKQLMCFFPVEKQTSYDRSHLLINLFAANDVHLTSVFWAIFFLFLSYKYRYIQIYAIAL